MTVESKVPEVGESITEGMLVAWSVEDGQAVGTIDTAAATRASQPAAQGLPRGARRPGGLHARGRLTAPRRPQPQAAQPAGAALRRQET